MVHYGWANGGSVYVFFISGFPTGVENMEGGGSPKFDGGRGA